MSASEYSDKSSATLRNISTIATEAGQWTKLNFDDCKRAYTPCQALIEYGNVIMVVNKPGGWIRDDMWKLQNDESRLWDQYIPPKQPNHLFFDTACQVSSINNNNQPGDCQNTCEGALGTSREFGDSLDWKRYNFIDVATRDCTYTSSFTASELQPSALDISVDYCLVQPLDTICRTFFPLPDEPSESPLQPRLFLIFVKANNKSYLTSVRFPRSRCIAYLTTNRHYLRGYKDIYCHFGYHFPEPHYTSTVIYPRRCHSVFHHKA